MADTTPQLAKPGLNIRTFTGWTIVFMVLLRISIGWHFFYEGIWKLNQDDWRATSFLVASAGPLRDTFRGMVKDVDGKEALTVKGMNARIDERFNILVKHYGITDEQLLKRLTEHRDGKKTVSAENPVPGASVESVFADKDFQRQLKDYGLLLEQIAEQEKALGTMGYEKERLTDMYARKANAKKALLTRAEVPLKEFEAYFLTQLNGEFAAASADESEKGPEKARKLESEQLAKAMPPEKSPTAWIDFSNMWGLTLVGACLILGLFTRFAALGGVGLLTMYYMCMPPFPGLPESPMSEGHYLIVNKNMIEAFALLAIATSGVGRWAGLDAFLGSRRVKAQATQAPASVSRPVSAGTV